MDRLIIPVRSEYVAATAPTSVNVIPFQSLQFDVDYFLTGIYQDIQKRVTVTGAPDNTDIASNVMFQPTGGISVYIQIPSITKGKYSYNTGPPYNSREATGGGLFTVGFSRGVKFFELGRTVMLKAGIDYGPNIWTQFFDNVVVGNYYAINTFFFFEKVGRSFFEVD